MGYGNAPTFVYFLCLAWSITKFLSKTISRKKFLSIFQFFLLNDFLIIGDEALAFYNEEDHSDDEPDELNKDFIDEGDNHPQSVIRQKIR